MNTMSSLRLAIDQRQSPSVFATGLAYPEGPVAMPDGELIVVEIAAGRVSRIAADGKVRVLCEPFGGPNGAALGPDGHIYVCNNGGFEWSTDTAGHRRVRFSTPGGRGRIERIDPETGKCEVLYDQCSGRPLSSPNDLVFDGHGGFWFTDLGHLGERDLGRGSLYYARADGSHINEVVFPMFMPNGVALSPTGTELYVAETVTARVWAFDVAAPGHLRLSSHSPPGRMLWSPQHYCRLDSMAVEENGNICVATLISGGITVLSSQGDRVDFVSTPDAHTTNLCFGGPDLLTAYVTLSGLGQVLAVPWKRPGLALNHG